MTGVSSIKVSPERAEQICKMLLEGHTTTAVGTSYGKSSSWVWNVAIMHGLIYDQASKHWMQRDAAKPSTAIISQEVVDGVVQSLLDGNGRDATGKKFGLTGEQVRTISAKAGLVHIGPRTGGKWIRQEEADMSNGAWNMTNEDYNALLKSEREDINGAALPEAETVADAAINSTLDDDIKEALDLLSKAEQRRHEDIATIEALKRDLESARIQTREQSQKVTDLKVRLQQAEARIDQLDTENRRLQKELKSEISRGLLRQGMDSLRKVL